MDSAQDKGQITTYTDLSASAQAQQCLYNKLNERLSTRRMKNGRSDNDFEANNIEARE